MCALVQSLAQHLRMMDIPITFTEEDARHVHFSHNDTLVVEAHIANKTVSQILVDNKISMNIMFKSAFHAIELTEPDLTLCPTQLQGFNRDALMPLGKIQLQVTLL